MFIDPYYLLFALPGLLLALWARSYVSSTFGRMSRMRSRSGLTGRDAARAVLSTAGLDVGVEPTPGSLTDHFDPRSRTIRLSEPVYASSSLAALGVAAHEAGHALQHSSGFLPARARSAFVPVASLGSHAAMPLFVLGMIFGLTQLQLAGIYLFAAVAAFQLVTLPVELDASRRALSALTATGVLSEDEIPGARAVLRAAALTYIAALVQSLLILLYMFSRRRR